MKHLFFVVFMLVSVMQIIAQPMQVQFSLQSGLSVPLLDFAANNMQKGSFALPGFTASAEAKAVIKNKWTGFIESGIQLNPLEVGLLGYEKLKAEPSLEDVYIRSDPFKVIHVLAGPGFQTRIWNSFLVEGQVGAGVFFSSTPYQLYKTKYYLPGPEYFEITPAKDVSFAYSAGLRFSYEVTPCYSIGLSSQLMNSKAAFRFLTGMGERIDNRNITLWNTSISITLKLFSVRGKQAKPD